MLSTYDELVMAKPTKTGTNLPCILISPRRDPSETLPRSLPLCACVILRRKKLAFKYPMLVRYTGPCKFALRETTQRLVVERLKRGFGRSHQSPLQSHR